MAWYDDLTSKFKGLFGFNGSNTSSYTLRPGDSVSNMYKQMGITDITGSQNPSTLRGMTRIRANYEDNMANTPTGVRNNSSQTNWGDYLGYGVGALEALSGLASAYTGYKNYQLAKDQFGFAKDAYNRNIANQAKVINNTYDNAAQVAAGMIGSKDSAGNYGMTDQAVVDRYANNAKKKHVDGSKIG